MDAARFRRAKDGPSENPRQKREAQGISGIGCRFFWVLFFGQAKKSTSAVGPRTDIKNIRRDSDTNKNS